MRSGGETKTKRSRRTLELPALCVDALREHRHRQLAERIRMGEQGVDNDLVFATQYGTELDAANVRRAFRTVAAAAGLEASEWTPRELRHSFVSLLSSFGVPIEDIAHLVGHASTNVTEKVSQGASASVEPWSDSHGCIVRWPPSWPVRLAVLTSKAYTVENRRRRGRRKASLTRDDAGGRYWVRTSDLFRVSDANVAGTAITTRGVRTEKFASSWLRPSRLAPYSALSVSSVSSTVWSRGPSLPPVSPVQAARLLRVARVCGWSGPRIRWRRGAGRRLGPGPRPGCSS
jgi:hypothetical protein